MHGPNWGWEGGFSFKPAQWVLVGISWQNCTGTALYLEGGQHRCLEAVIAVSSAITCMVSCAKELWPGPMLSA